MKKTVLARRSSQAFFLLLFVYILWSTTYPLEGILPPETFFRTNPLIMIFTSVSERILLPGLLFALAMLALTLLLGRFYCGWICPLGTIIDLTGALRKRKFSPDDRANRILRKIKFFALGIMTLAALAGVQIAWVMDPMVITGRFVSLNLIPTATLLIDKAFIFLIRDVGLSGPLHDTYRFLRSSFLGVKIAYFDSSGPIFLVFFFVCVSALVLSRFWCRTLCPLGALYALAARFSLMRRVVERCTNCGICISECRMGAIKEDNSYIKGECILCMDCVADCPVNGTRFTFFPGRSEKPGLKGAENTSGRKEFLFLLVSSFFLTGFRGKSGSTGKKNTVIRPPLALKEKDFVDRCIRCGNCMKVCPTNGLHPVMLQAGPEGIWTPQLVPEIGYCEYTCTLCGNVCPTGAIARVTKEEKLKVKLGVAEVDRSACIAWNENKDCIVCEEHCPVAEKAIKVDEKVINGRAVKRPVVDPSLCVGCGICQNKCPARPVRAIRVSPRTADRA